MKYTSTNGRNPELSLHYVKYVELHTKTNTLVNKAADKRLEIANHFKVPYQTTMQTMGILTCFLQSRSQTTNPLTPLSTVSQPVKPLPAI